MGYSYLLSIAAIHSVPAIFRWGHNKHEILFPHHSQLLQSLPTVLDAAIRFSVINSVTHLHEPHSRTIKTRLILPSHLPCNELGVRSLSGNSETVHVRMSLLRRGGDRWGRIGEWLGKALALALKE